jgi:hypothetical protein
MGTIGHLDEQMPSFLHHYSFFNNLLKNMVHRHLVLILMLFLGSFKSYAQETNKVNQSFGLQAGLILLENPFVLYPSVNLSYSRSFLVKGRYQLAFMPQLGFIPLPTIENKFLFSTSLQYKYVSEKRFEANVFLGLNYQLRQLQYDRYALEGNELVNKGSILHQFGPTTGLNIGYKIIKKEKYSISPNIGFSFTKLNKIYQANIFQGYKPTVLIGITINK